MRVRIVALLLAGVVCLTRSAVAAPIVLTPNGSANGLLTSILGTVTGLTGLTATLSGDPSASGTFSGGPFGLNSGIVLSTGQVSDLGGGNTVEDAGIDLGALGEPGDTTVLTVGFTSDATVTDLLFNYVFGSEEFTEFIGSEFNDFFALTLDNVNFALLQCGSSVKVNNFVGACASELTLNGAGTETQLDAFTKVLQFAAPLTPGLHELKFTIADIGDGLYDSAVFVQAGSLRTVVNPVEPPPPAVVPEPSTLVLLGTGVLGLVVARRRRA